MYSIIKSFVNISNKKNKNKDNHLTQNDIESFEAKQQMINGVNMISNKIGKELDNNSTEYRIAVDSNLESTISTYEKLSIGPDVIGNFDKTKIKKNNIAENKSVYDSHKNKLLNQIDSLHCLFTWKLKPTKKHNFIGYIKNKYGDNNLDISLFEFTFAR